MSLLRARHRHHLIVDLLSPRGFRAAFSRQVLQLTECDTCQDSDDRGLWNELSGGELPPLRRPDLEHLVNQEASP